MSSGAAHNACNLKLRIYPERQYVPVVFHNLKHYDGHHLISAIGATDVDEITYTDRKGKERTMKLGEISIVPTNMEKYVTFKWRQYR